MSKRFRDDRFDEDYSRKRFNNSNVELNYDDEGGMVNGHDEEEREEKEEEDQKDQKDQNQKKSKTRKKHKTKSNKFSDLDHDNEQRMAFPISITNATSSDGPPLSVEDYISSVRHEVKSLPSMVSIRSKEEEEEEYSNMTVNHHGECLQSLQNTKPAAYIIDLEWHKKFIEEFKIIRELENYTSSDSPSIPANLPKTVKEWRKLFFSPSVEPQQSLIKSFELPLVLKLLHYTQKWISIQINPQLSKWIFILLIRLPSILTADDVSILRELAKKARKIKLKTNSLDPTTKFTIDIIISITSGIYGQNDLLFIE